MLYDDIATTIILLPSVTKTFAMSTVLCSILSSYCCVGKKGIGKLNATAKELVSARALLAELK